MTNIVAPVMSLIFLLLSNGFFMTFITVRSNLLDISPIENGYYHSAYYAGLMLGALTSEKLIAKIGHIRAYATFASITTITILLLAVINTTYGWIILRFLAGGCFAALCVSIESWLLAESDSSTRGKILAIYMGAFYSSQAFGQFILKYVDPTNFEPYLVTSLLCSLSVIPVAITFRPSPVIHEHPPLKPVESYLASPCGFIGCICAGLIVSAIYSFLPDFAQDNKLSVPSLMFLTIIGGFILQWPIGILSDIFERRKIMTIISFILVVPCLLIIFSGNSPTLTRALCFIIGGLCFVIYPISITMVCDNTPQEKILSATSMLLVIYSLGAIMGPIIVSNFIGLSFSSSTALFIYIAIIAVTLGVISLSNFARKPQAEDYLEQQTEFVPMPTNTIIANELDPRMPEREEDEMIEEHIDISEDFTPPNAESTS